MTKDNIIKLAREHGADIGTSGQWLLTQEQLEAFFHAAQKLERERIADDLEHGFVDDEGHHIQYAEAIRNRSAP